MRASKHYDVLYMQVPQVSYLFGSNFVATQTCRVRGFGPADINHPTGSCSAKCRGYMLVSHSNLWTCMLYLLVPMFHEAGSV